ncbi:DUF3696 domain-containing protein [Desulfobacterales bacterium HSG16]|nr:DUF3696 domain-containing protein [Desulfobacterales bacterium HSG16]
MLESITIKNFKALKDVELILSNLTVIAGINNSGKSSLIQILLLIRQSFEQNTLAKDGLLLNGRFINIGNGRDALSIDAENDAFFVSLHWENKERLELEFACRNKSNLQPLKRIEPEKFNQANILFAPRIQYLAAQRTDSKDVFPVSDYDINTLHSLGNHGQYTAHFIAEYGAKPLKNSDLQHEKARSKTLLANIDAWLSEISPGVKVTANVIPEINQASLLYEFATSYGYTEKFRPVNVGFGLTYILPVVTAILASKPGDLIIIENPEAHLHPAGQSAIAALICLAAQSGVQLIIETHSDHFLNGVRVEVKNNKISPENVSLFYFSRDADSKEHAIEITQPFINADGKIDEWPKGFLDEWDNNLNKLLDF